jgi:hypothetical protein
MRKGDIITITNTSPSGKPFVEGKVKLIRKVTAYPNPYGFELWKVEFLTDPGEIFERFIPVAS